VLIALGHVYVQISHREEAAELMRDTQEHVREQPGCELYAFSEVLDDPGHFLSVQEWRDRAALDEHYRSEPFQRYQAQIGAYLARSSELRVHEVSASARPVESSPIDVSQGE
jgi:quinol monooxygenase YgiN